MKLFKRSKRLDPTLPPEVQAYSNAEHRERIGMAWLVGIVSLLVALLITTGIYFGGRWLYRQIAHNDRSKPGISKTVPKTSKPKVTPKSPKKADTSATSSDHTNVPVQAPPATTTPTASTPKTGDDTNETLVRTGPDIDL